MGGDGVTAFADAVTTTEIEAAAELGEAAGFELRLSPRITPATSAISVEVASSNHLTRGRKALNRRQSGCTNPGESCVRDVRGPSEVGISSSVVAVAETIFTTDS